MRILSGNGKNGQQELKANSKLRLYWPSWPNHVVFSISASNQKGAHTCTLTDQQQNAGETLPRAFHVNLQLQGTHFVHANNPARFSFSPKRWRSNVCINCSRTSKKARVTFDSLTADSSHTCRISALKKIRTSFQYHDLSTNLFNSQIWQRHDCLTGKYLHQIVCKIQAIYKPWLCCSVGMPKRLALALPILRYSWVRRDKALAIH